MTEALLFGTAAVKAVTGVTATATAAAIPAIAAAPATAGLFGSAGAFSLGSSLATSGTALSAGGTLMGASANAAATEFQQSILERQANRELELGELEATRIEKEGSRIQAINRARMAASGIDPGSGTALLLSDDADSDIELAALTARSGQVTAANNIFDQSSLVGSRNSRYGGYVGAATKLLSASSRIGRPVSIGIG